MPSAYDKCHMFCKGRKLKRAIRVLDFGDFASTTSAKMKAYFRKPFNFIQLFFRLPAPSSSAAPFPISFIACAN